MRTWAVAKGVAWRVVKNVLTNRSLLLPSLLFPLMFFVAFAGGLAQVQEVPGFEYAGNYTGFQYGFVLLQGSAFSGVFTGFAVARDFETGFAKRLLLSAPDRRGILLGYWLASATRAAIIMVVLTTVALVARMDVGGNPAELAAMFLLAFLVNAAGALWAFGIAFRFRTIQAGPLMQLPVFLVLFFAPVYVPLDLLEGWIELVASVNPVTFVLEEVRGLLVGDAGDAPVAFAVALAVVAALGVWALRGLRRAEASG